MNVVSNPQSNTTLTGANRSDAVTVNCDPLARGNELEFAYDHNSAKIKKWNYVRVNRDDVRHMYGQIARIAQFYDGSIRAFVNFDDGYTAWVNVDLTFIKPGGAE